MPSLNASLSAASSSGSVTSISTFSLVVASVGDLLAVGVTLANSSVTVSSVTDSRGNTYSKQLALSHPTKNLRIEQWTATAGFAGFTAVTVNLSSGARVVITFSDWTSVGSLGATQTGNNTSSSSLTLNVSATSGSVLWGVFGVDNHRTFSATSPSAVDLQNQNGDTTGSLITGCDANSTSTSIKVSSNANADWVGLAIELRGPTSNISAPDSGSGNDQIAITVSFTVADTGTGTDSDTVIIPKTLSADTGSGSDTITVLTAIGPQIDWHGAAPLSGTAVGTLVVNTTGTSDELVIWAGMQNAGRTILSITDSLGVLSFSRLALYNATGPSLDVWFAKATQALTNDTLTITISSSTIRWEVGGAAWTLTDGPDGNQPWTNHGASGAVPTVSGITLANPNDVLLAIETQGLPLTQTAGPGFALLDAPSQSSHSSADEWESVSTTGIGSVAFGTNSTSNWTMAVVALTILGTFTPIVIGDVGLAVDKASVPQETLTPREIGTGLDAVSVQISGGNNTINLTDFAHAGDSLVIVNSNPTVFDTGNGLDSVSVSQSSTTININLADTGFGNDALCTGGMTASIPFTFTNQTLFQLPANFQQKITVNLSLYSPYVTSDLSNLLWQDGDGFPLNSWRENGTSSADTADVYWVLIPEAIPPGASKTIYLCTFNQQVLDGNFTGEFPDAISGVANWAKYDNGASVFDFYDSFKKVNSSGLPSSNWASINNVTPVQNAGLSIFGSIGSQWAGLKSTLMTSVPAGELIEAYMTTDAITGGALAVDGGNGFEVRSDTLKFRIEKTAPNFTSNLGEGGTFVDDTLYIVGGNNLTSTSIYVNYSSQTSTTSGIQSNGALEILTYDNQGGTYANWVRARKRPISDVMPTVSAGSLAACATTEITVNVTISDAGTSSDIMSAGPTISLSDTGSSDDATGFLVAQAITASDTGSGSDTAGASISTQITISDFGSGNDFAQIGNPSIGINAKQVKTSKMSGKLKITKQTASVKISKMGGVAQVVKGVIPGKGITVIIPISELGSGLDAISITISGSALISAPDRGFSDDSQITVDKGIPKSVHDVGSGSDSVVVTNTTNLITVFDVGSGLDSVSATGQAPSVSDTGASLDLVGLTIPFTIPTDTGSSIDGVSVVNHVGPFPINVHDTTPKATDFVASGVNTGSGPWSFPHPPTPATTLFWCQISDNMTGTMATTIPVLAGLLARTQPKLATVTGTSTSPGNDGNYWLQNATYGIKGKYNRTLTQITNLTGSGGVLQTLAAGFTSLIEFTNGNYKEANIAATIAGVLGKPYLPVASGSDLTAALADIPGSAVAIDARGMTLTTLWAQYGPQIEKTIIGANPAGVNDQLDYVCGFAGGLSFDEFAGGLTTTNASSSGKTLNVGSLTGFSVGDLLTIAAGTSRAETATIASIGTSTITTTTTLQFTHPSGDSVTSQEATLAEQVLSTYPAGTMFVGFWSGSHSADGLAFGWVTGSGEVGSVSYITGKGMGFHAANRGTRNTSITAGFPAVTATQQTVSRILFDPTKVYVCWNWTQGDAWGYDAVNNYQDFIDTNSSSTPYRNFRPMSFPINLALATLHPEVVSAYYAQSTGNTFIYPGPGAVGYSHLFNLPTIAGVPFEKTWLAVAAPLMSQLDMEGFMFVIEGSGPSNQQSASAIATNSPAGTFTELQYWQLGSIQAMQFGTPTGSVIPWIRNNFAIMPGPAEANFVGTVSAGASSFNVDNAAPFSVGDIIDILPGSASEDKGLKITSITNVTSSGCTLSIAPATLAHSHTAGDNVTDYYGGIRKATGLGSGNVTHFVEVLINTQNNGGNNSGSAAEDNAMTALGSGYIPVRLDQFIDLMAQAGLTGKPTFGFTRVFQGAQWNIWATPSWVAQHGSTLTTALKNYPDQYTPQLLADFNFLPNVPFPLPNAVASWDGGRMDIVLDPKAQGGAHTGSLFGSFGVSESPDVTYNVFNGITGFFYYILSLHESVNVFTGSLAQDWPWADGSSAWNGTSPFPNFCDVQVTKELGLTAVSNAQQGRIGSDPFVSFFQTVFANFGGWYPFQLLFYLTSSNNITNWASYSEPLRTSILILFLSAGAHTDLSSSFIAAESSAGVPSGNQITSSSFNQAKTAGGWAINITLNSGISPNPVTPGGTASINASGGSVNGTYVVFLHNLLTTVRYQVATGSFSNTGTASFNFTVPSTVAVGTKYLLEIEDLNTNTTGYGNFFSVN